MTATAAGRLRAAGAVLAGTALAAGAALLALPATAPPAQAAPAPRVAVILMDTNGSVAGAAAAAERQAAVAYARALPADVRAALINFGDHWRLALAPTAGRGEFAAAVTASRFRGATSRGIYGALAGAQSVLRRLGAASSSRMLVLSDGEDLAGPALTSAAPADIVTARYDADDRLAPLRALAAASGGRAERAPADVAALASVFPGAPGGRAPSGPAVAAHAGGWSWQLILVVALVFLALLSAALLAVGAASGGDRRRRLVEQLDRYGPRHAPAPPGGDRAVARTAVGLTAQLLQGSNAEQGLARRLDLAGMSRKPAEWALLGVAAGAGLCALLSLLTGSVPISVLIGIPVAWLGMRLVLSLRISRRRAAFAMQLPDVLQFLTGSLRSGFSLGQALESAAREDTQPAAGEFRRALAEARVGVDLDVALSAVADRMDSTDLRWAVMAIRIQREVGGNLAEVVGNTIATMRERAFLQRHVRSLSAEGRLSAYILIALPLLVGGWLLLTDRTYLSPLYTTPLGLAMLAVCLVLFVVGVFWMRAVVKVEV